MRNSRSFINFALFFCMMALTLGITSCKGRTIENMEPSGDTIEVVIMQPDTVQIDSQNLIE